MKVNADECYKLQKEISSEFENIFPNSSRQDGFMKKKLIKQEIV